MASVLRGSSRTTPHVRAELQGERPRPCLPLRREREDGAQIFKRTTMADEPLGPKTPKSTVLTPAEEAIVVAFRQKTPPPLDDGLGCFTLPQGRHPNLSRSALHRCLQRHGLSRIPVGETRERRPADLYQDSLIRTHGPNCEGRWT
jgi:hypothetical protein